MSISPIGTRVPTIAPNSIIRAGIPLPDNFNATDVAVSLGSLLASVSVSRFDVTFTGLEFKNIGTTPLLLIESSRTIIVTSIAAILTEQTEAFDFSAGVSITTTTLSAPQAYAIDIFITQNGNGVFPIGTASLSGTIGQGNAYAASKDGNDSATGDGFVRIIGTYYEIDL